MFQGPAGMLAPIPVRISQASVPRTIPRPSMRAAKIAPVRTQTTTPAAPITTKSRAVRSWRVETTSA